MAVVSKNANGGSEMFTKIRHISINNSRVIFSSFIMPKHNKQGKNTEILNETGAVSLKPNGTILIKILAKPGAKQNAITEITEENIGIQINAPPVEGAANTELIKYLSTLLKVKKNDLTLEKGNKSRDKIISISSQLTTTEHILESFNHEKMN